MNEATDCFAPVQNIRFHRSIPDRFAGSVTEHPLTHSPPERSL